MTSSFFVLLIILCLIPSYISTTWNYNCGNMTSLLFPVPKTIPPAKHNITYDTQDTPEMDKMIAEVQQKLLPSMPRTTEEAYKQFEQMKIKRNVGRSANTLVLNPEQDFEDKMKLYQISDFIKLADMNLAFPFICNQSPKFWVNERYKYLRFLQGVEVEEIIKADRLRFPRSSVYGDPCKDLAESLREDKGWSQGAAKDAYKLVIRCYETFPFDYNSSRMVYDLMSFLSEFYVFANFTSVGSGIPMFVQNLKDQNFPFASNFRLHACAKDIINHAGDAHCSYKAKCYEQFTFVQPLFLQYYVEDNNDKVIINKVSLPLLEEWVNAEVLFIDGDHKIPAIYRFVNKIGLTYSEDSRVSRSLSRRYWSSQLGDFTFDRGLYLLRYTAPNRPYLVFSLRKPGTDYVYEIKVDWLVFKGSTLNSFNDQYSYWQLNCAAKPFVKKTTKVKRRSLKPKPKLEKRLVATSPSIVSRYTYEETRIVVIGPEFAFLTANDPVEGDYAILAINSFNVVDIEGWYIGMQQGFQYLIDKGYKKLILELSGNSGGVICLAYALLAVLSPSTELPFPATKQPYPTATSPTAMLVKFSNCAAEAKFSQSPLQMQSYLNEKRLPYQPGASWNDNKTSNTRYIGGFSQGTSSFSPYLLDACQSKENSLLKDIKPKFTTLVVSTDGFCGSSCAIVAANLQEVQNPAIIFTPRNTERIFSPNVYSFAGGQVISLDNIKDIAKRSSCYGDVPQTLEELTLTLTYRCIFSVNHPEIPLEYLILPANGTILHSRYTVDSMKERWFRALYLGLDIQRFPDAHFVNTSYANLVGGMAF